MGVNKTEKWGKCNLNWMKGENKLFRAKKKKTFGVQQRMVQYVPSLHDKPFHSMAVLHLLWAG